MKPFQKQLAAAMLAFFFTLSLVMPSLGQVLPIIYQTSCTETDAIGNVYTVPGNCPTPTATPTPTLSTPQPVGTGALALVQCAVEQFNAPQAVVYFQNAFKVGDTLIAAVKTPNVGGVQSVTPVSGVSQITAVPTQPATGADMLSTYIGYPSAAVQNIQIANVAVPINSTLVACEVSGYAIASGSQTGTTTNTTLTIPSFVPTSAVNLPISFFGSSTGAALFTTPSSNDTVVPASFNPAVNAMYAYTQALTTSATAVTSSINAYGAGTLTGTTVTLTATNSPPIITSPSPSASPSASPLVSPSPSPSASASAAPSPSPSVSPTIAPLAVVQTNMKPPTGSTATPIPCDSATTSVVCSLPVAPTVGDTLVFAVQHYGSALLTFPSAAPNNATLVTTYSPSSEMDIYAEPVTSAVASANSYPFATNASNHITVAVLEISGTAVNLISAPATSTENPATASFASLTTGSITPSVIGMLPIAFFGDVYSATTVTPSANVGWSEIFQDLDSTQAITQSSIRQQLEVQAHTLTTDTSTAITGNVTWGSSTVQESIILLFAPVPQVVAVTPMRSYDFIDTIGVNSHQTYAGTNILDVNSRQSVYNGEQTLGIRHIRDNGTNSVPFSLGIMTDVVEPSCNTGLPSGVAGSSGINPGLGPNTNNPTSPYYAGSNYFTPASYLSSGVINGTSRVDAIEMCNEPNGASNGGYDDFWQYDIPASAPGMSTAVHNAGIQLIAPAFQTLNVASTFQTPGPHGNGGSGQQNGLAGAHYLPSAVDLSSYFDHLNIHAYNNRWPGLTSSANNGSATYVKNAYNALTGPTYNAANDTYWVTETGWSHGPTENGGANLVAPQKQIARWMPLLFLDNWHNGIARTYVFNNVDANAAACPGVGVGAVFSSFGLMSYTDQSTSDSCTVTSQGGASPTLQFDALENFINLLNDPSPAFAPTPLSYVLTGSTNNLYSQLFQKSNGVYLLALWQNVDDYTEQTTLPSTDPTPVPAENVTVQVANQSNAQMTGAYASQFTDSGGINVSAVTDVACNGALNCYTVPVTSNLTVLQIAPAGFTPSTPVPSPTPFGSTTPTPVPIPPLVPTPTPGASATPVPTATPTVAPNPSPSPSPSPTSTPTSIPTTPPTPGPLTVSPTSLPFANPSAAAQTVTITDPLFSGTYTVTPSLANIVTALINGTAITVTPVNVGSTTLTVSDGTRTKTVSVVVAPAPPTIVSGQSVSCDSATGTISTCALPNNPTAGNMVAIFANHYTNTLTTSLSTALNVSSYFPNSQQDVYVMPITGATANNFPMSDSAGNQLTIAVVEIAGSSVNSIAGIANATTGQSSFTTIAGGVSVKPTSLSTLPIAAFSSQYNVAPSAPATGWTQILSNVASDEATPRQLMELQTRPQTTDTTTNITGNITYASGTAITATVVLFGPASYVSPNLSVNAASMTFNNPSVASQTATIYDPSYSGTTFTIASSTFGIVNASITGSQLLVSPAGGVGSTTLTITDPNGKSDSLVVTVNQPTPSLDQTNNTTPCYSATGVITGCALPQQAAVGDVLVFEVDTGNGTVTHNLGSTAVQVATANSTAVSAGLGDRTYILPVTASTGNSFNFTSSTNYYTSVVVLDISGTSVNNVTAITGYSASAGAVTGSQTPSVIGELPIAMYDMRYGANPFTAASGWTQVVDNSATDPTRYQGEVQKHALTTDTTTAISGSLNLTGGTVNTSTFLMFSPATVVTPTAPPATPTPTSTPTTAPTTAPTTTPTPGPSGTPVVSIDAPGTVYPYTATLPSAMNVVTVQAEVSGVTDTTGNAIAAVNGSWALEAGTFDSSTNCSTNYAPQYCLHFYDYGSGSQALPGTQLAPNTNYLITGINDGVNDTLITCIVGGTTCVTTVQAMSTPGNLTSATSLIIGAAADMSRTFSGHLWKLRVWNYARTVAQVTNTDLPAAVGDPYLLNSAIVRQCNSATGTSTSMSVPLFLAPVTNSYLLGYTNTLNNSGTNVQPPSNMTYQTGLQSMTSGANDTRERINSFWGPSLSGVNTTTFTNAISSPWTSTVCEITGTNGVIDSSSTAEFDNAGTFSFAVTPTVANDLTLSFFGDNTSSLPMTAVSGTLTLPGSNQSSSPAASRGFYKLLGAGLAANSIGATSP